MRLHERNSITLVVMSATMLPSFVTADVAHVHLGMRPYPVRIVPVQLVAAGDWQRVATDLACSTARHGKRTRVCATGEEETEELTMS